MHPCREYWGQDVAYGSLVAGERPRRATRATPAEIWIMDTPGDARADRHAELAGLMRRIGGLAAGEEDALRQSASQLKAFLQAGEDRRILGIAALHRTHLLPAGSFAAAAGVPATAAREEASALLCAEFMHHLGRLAAGDGVSQIDWVMVRATDTADATRSHLGATRVTGVALTPFAPDAPASGY